MRFTTLLFNRDEFKQTTFWQHMFHGNYIMKRKTVGDDSGLMVYTLTLHRSSE
jgi:hypothetical protein